IEFGLQQGDRVGEIVLLGVAPGRRAVKARGAQQARARQRIERLQRLAQGRGGVADVAAKADRGGDRDGHHPVRPSLRRRRRRRRAGGAPASSSPSPPASVTSWARSPWASRQNATSSACSGEATSRRARKSNAARKRGCASRRPTRL